MHLETVLLLAVIQGYVQATLLWTGKRRRRVANRLFAVLLTLFSSAIAFHLLGETAAFRALDPLLRDLSAVLMLAFGPLLLFYARALAGVGLGSGRSLPLHFLPVVVGLAALALSAAGGGWSRAFGHGLLSVLVGLQVSAYLGVIVFGLVRHSRSVRQVYAALSAVDLGWLRLLTSLLAAFWVTAAVFETLEGLHPGLHRSWSGVWVVLAGLVFVIGYQGLWQPEVFLPVLEGRPPGPERRYEKSALTPEDATRYLQRLEQVMADQQPHLDSRITLPELASRLGISLHDLSRILNERLGRNFYEFVNGYRVAEAQRMIHDPASAHLTLAAIANRCGFNSISAFNSAFKRSTGKTPSHFRRAGAGPPVQG